MPAYDQKFRERAFVELGHLPENSVILEMLKDYSVMRDQSRACLNLKL